MSIQILDWIEISSWSWDFDDDTCTYCQNSINSCCAQCTIPGDLCPPILGECGHVFHYHCIEYWIKEHGTCPICRRPWKEVEFMDVD